jgi:hypothetical protein
MIRPRFALEKNENEQFLRIEWGKFRSMGEAFEFFESEVKKLVIFQ